MVRKFNELPLDKKQLPGIERRKMDAAQKKSERQMPVGKPGRSRHLARRKRGCEEPENGGRENKPKAVCDNSCLSKWFSLSKETLSKLALFNTQAGRVLHPLN